MNHFQNYINVQDYCDLDSNKAINILSKSITCKTISYTDPKLFDINEFNKLQDLLSSSFKNIKNNAIIKKFDKSILYYIKGKDSTLNPILLMAHQDVVPVDTNTNNQWKYSPFSGFIDDNYVWGRGALDIKCLMIAEMFAVDYLLGKGFVPSRGIYLAFGHDEEVGGFNGTKKIASYLKNNAVTLDFVIDEGFGFISSGDRFGANNLLIGQIGLFEKGFLDLELEVEGQSGHSSNPYHGTALAHMSNAISNIVNNPYPPYICDILLDLLREIKDDIVIEPLKTYVKDINKNKTNICSYFQNNKDLNILVQTTIAPTMISGGSIVSNVMPEKIKATINFRLNMSQTCKEIIDYSNRVVGNDKVKITTSRMIEASKVSRYNNAQYIAIKESLQKYYKNVKFVPSICTCGTDSRHYEIICDSIYRLYPFYNDPNIYSSIHSINERIEKKAFIQGIKVLINIVEKYCK